MLKYHHRSTLFRGYFILPENFIYLLSKCRGNEQLISTSDLTPFDLESEVAKRVRRNDISFITTDGRLIILVEHQTTINPNMALRLFLYYNELIQLWIKQNSINIYSKEKIQSLPTVEFYVVYNGTAELKEEYSTFKQDNTGIKIEKKVKIVDIRFNKLNTTSKENSLVGYAYFYNEYDNNIKNGASKEKAFETARTKCINEGYMQGFIEREDFIMFYKNFLDYDEQLKAEAREEAKEEVKAEVKAEAKEEGFFEAALKFLQGGTSPEDVVRILGLTDRQAKELESRCV
jgi:hypothetical protein